MTDIRISKMNLEQAVSYSKTVARGLRSELNIALEELDEDELLQFSDEMRDLLRRVKIYGKRFV